jgi:ADP-ribose pyrophosphatase
MPHRGPWQELASEVVLSTPHFDVHRDRVERPDGSPGQYDWISAPDQVRVAALVADTILLIDQHHYLIGRTLQLPGGSLEGEEGSEVAARRELQQETGFHGGVWAGAGTVSPLPGLAPTRVHLWSARDLTPGTATPEPSERDLRVVRMTLAEARDAVLAGRVQCAASALLIVRVAAGFQA